MKAMLVVSIVLIATVAGFLALPIQQAYSHSDQRPILDEKPPELIQGGKWTDDFWIGQIQEAQNIDIQVGHLFLKYLEQFHWTQTWTAHFAEGDFYHTEAIADSVRLAWNDQQQNYFTTGIYTSTVFFAGRFVDWASSEWRYSGIPDGLTVEFRTGGTQVPDQTWSSWQEPERVFLEYYCAYTFNTDETECFTTMSGIDSSPYIQYRATFSSNDSTQTVALYDIDFIYGIHCLSGSVLSIPIPPIDLKGWEQAVITSTIPAGTVLVIDIVAPNGLVLLQDIKDGDSLESIDPIEYPAIQLRASLSSSDDSISPDIDLWGVKWTIWDKIYLPDVLR